MKMKTKTKIFGSFLWKFPEFWEFPDPQPLLLDCYRPFFAPSFKLNQVLEQIQPQWSLDPSWKKIQIIFCWRKFGHTSWSMDDNKFQDGHLLTLNRSICILIHFKRSMNPDGNDTNLKVWWDSSGWDLSTMNGFCTDQIRMIKSIVIDVPSQLSNNGGISVARRMTLFVNIIFDI